jgi:hypothetical protein
MAILWIMSVLSLVFKTFAKIKGQEKSLLAKRALAHKWQIFSLATGVISDNV